MKNGILIGALACVLVLVFGCLTEKETKMSDLLLFEKIEIGMSRIAAEGILGKPITGGDNGEVYYGKPPNTEIWQSPLAPASILVVYTSNNVVHSKQYYP